MSVSSVTILGKDELDKKHQLEQSVIDGIELGKKGFQQAAQTLLRIDETNNFDKCREKFRGLLVNTDVSFRLNHRNRATGETGC